MVNNSPSVGRAALVARSRRYLAAVVAGGVAVGGGLTLAAAAAQVDTTARAAQPRQSSTDAGRHPARRVVRHQAQRPRATSPVRAVHHPRPASQPAASTHAS